ncbi:MAG: hypothetical protein S4CHLAM20_04600 [Chlamydiia bacterium]|nr:hypothetical protein [Chlamydiia bacterium]
MVISSAIWFLIGSVNGIKDKSALNLFKRPYWNKGEGWKYKWKLDKSNRTSLSTRKEWYYLWLYKPLFKESFPYSSTALVFITDGWHLLQFIQFKLAIISVVTHSESEMSALLQFGILLICFSSGFWITYERK